MKYINEGFKLVDDFLSRGIFVKSQGAIIADLEAYNLGVLPIIRSDGTALYPVADLALAKHKFEDYKLNESVYIVDIRQGLYFKQLAQIFALAGEKFKITHLGYDFVTLKSGMMSSRSGNVITYNEILSEALSRADIKDEVVDTSLLIHNKESILALYMERFPEAVIKAGEQRDPSAVARYLFELAQAFNDYYHEVNVLKAEPSLLAARVSLLLAVRQVLANGFKLLGFSYLEEM